MANIYRSLSFSFLERGLLLGVTLVSYVLIARWLTPEEIGIYSVAAALVVIGQVVREFGVGNFLIQEKSLNRDNVSTALGVSLLLGVGLFALFIIIAPLAASFYRDERIATIVRLVAFGFLVMPFTVVPVAMLRRNMYFARLAAVNVVSNLVGTPVTLGLAYMGYGPQSLAWGGIAVSAVTAAAAWIALPDRMLARPSLREARKIFSFGAQSAGAAVVTTIAMDISDLAVARVLSFTSAAICNRANGLVNLFNQQVMSSVRSVALPAFALAYREGKALEPLYVSSVAAVSAFAWPFFGFISIYAKDVLRIMFGPQWDASAPLVPIFSACGALGATYSLALTLAIAMGRVEVATKTDMIVQPLRALTVIAAVVVFQTIESVGWATLAVNLVGTPYFLYVKNRLLPTDWTGMRQALGASLWLTAVCLAAPAAWAIAFAVDGVAGVPATVAQAAITAAVWLPALFWLRHPLSKNAFVLRIRDLVVGKLPVLRWLLPVLTSGSTSRP